MKVTLVGNAGVWLRETGHSLLLDSLYGKNEFFSSPLAEMDAAAAGLASHFRDADAVLFSHRHEDHFNARLVNEMALSRADGWGFPRSSFREEKPWHLSAYRWRFLLLSCFGFR